MDITVLTNSMKVTTMSQDAEVAYQNLSSTLDAKPLSDSAMYVLYIMSQSEFLARTNANLSGSVDFKRLLKRDGIQITDDITTAAQFYLEDIEPFSFVRFNASFTELASHNSASFFRRVSSLERLNEVLKKNGQAEINPAMLHYSAQLYFLSAAFKRYLSEHPDFFAPLLEKIRIERENQTYLATILRRRAYSSRSEEFGVSGLYRIIRETASSYYVEPVNVEGAKMVLKSHVFDNVTSRRNGILFVAKKDVYKKDITLEEYKRLRSITEAYWQERDEAVKLLEDQVKELTEAHNRRMAQKRAMYADDIEGVKGD